MKRLFPAERFLALILVASRSLAALGRTPDNSPRREGGPGFGGGPSPVGLKSFAGQRWASVLNHSEAGHSSRQSRL